MAPGCMLARAPCSSTTDAKAWYARVRHEGFYERLADDSIVRAVDDNKEPTAKPVLLDADGVRVTEPANTVWLEFPRFNPLPYSGLGLL